MSLRRTTIEALALKAFTIVTTSQIIDAPESSNTLIYVLRHPNREAAAANWKAFQEDPEWQRVKKESEANGKLTEKIDSTFLVLTDFSPGL